MKIISNKKYKKYEDAEFDAVMYYNAYQLEKTEKDKLDLENIQLQQKVNFLLEEITLLKEKIKNDKKKIKNPKKNV